MSDKSETQMPDPARLAEIRTRAAAATPGPWWSNGYSAVCATVPDAHPLAVSCPDEPGVAIVATVADREDAQGDELREPEARANARFIAHARADVPYLLALVDHLQHRNTVASDLLCEIGMRLRQTIAGLPGSEELVDGEFRLTVERVASVIERLQHRTECAWAAERRIAATAAEHEAELARLRERVATLESALTPYRDRCQACRGTGRVERSVFRGSGMDWETDSCSQCAAARKALGMETTTND